MGSTCSTCQQGSDPGTGGTGSTGDTGTSTDWWSSWTGLDDFGNYVGGLIGSTIEVLVSPLNALGNAFSSGLNAVGNALDSVGSSIGGWFSDLGSNIHSWTTDFSSSVGGWFSNFLGGVKDNVSSIFTKMGTIVDYLNPNSSNFFIKIAFVPSATFMDSYNKDMHDLWYSKFAIFSQLQDTFTAVKSAVDSSVNHWDGLQVDLSKYGIGKQTIVDPSFANMLIPKLKFWIGGLVYFLTAMWLLRKISIVVGAGR
jgi:Flp pilus assembly pilin Flp